MNIYVGLIISGFVVLLVSLFADIFDSFELDIDFGVIEIGNLDIQFLPISMRAISLALIVFCSSSLILGDDSTLKIVISSVFAYLSAIIVQTFTHYLKKHQHEADDIESLKFSHAKVVIAIKGNGVGSVACSRANQSNITLIAKSADGIDIGFDTDVIITDFDGEIAIVRAE